MPGFTSSSPGQKAKLEYKVNINWSFVWRVSVRVSIISFVICCMFFTIRNIGLPFGCDTDIFLAAAHAVLLGQNPLDVHGYIYPPILAILLAPMALVPAPVGFWIWMVLVWCSTGALVWALHHLVGWRVAAVAVLALPATYVSAYAGNVNAFIALGWGLALLAVQARRPTYAALWLVSGAMIKLVPGVGLAVLAVRRNWHALGAACILAGSILVVSLPLVGIRAWTDGVLSAATMPVEDRVMILISWTGILEAARAPTWIIIAFTIECIALLLLRAPHIDDQWAISAASLSPLLVARITWSTHLVSIRKLPYHTKYGHMPVVPAPTSSPLFCTSGCADCGV